MRVCLSNVTAFVGGFCAAVALVASGLSDPKVVWQFFELRWPWPLLLFFGGSLITYAALYYRIVTRLRKPMLSEQFDWHSIPQHVSMQLIVGAILFGVGWGLSGLCPGPALVAAFSGQWEGWITLSSIVVGMTMALLFVYRHHSYQHSRMYVVRCCSIVFFIWCIFTMSHQQHQATTESGAAVDHFRRQQQYDGVSIVNATTITGTCVISHHIEPVVTLGAAIVFGSVVAMFSIVLGNVFGFAGFIRQTLTRPLHWRDLHVTFFTFLGLILGAQCGTFLFQSGLIGTYTFCHNDQQQKVYVRYAYYHGNSNNSDTMIMNVESAKSVVTMVSTRPAWRYFLGGVLIGIGSTFANGCTSGHGICGFTRMSQRSIVSLILFMTSAFVTVSLIKLPG